MGTDIVWLCECMYIRVCMCVCVCVIPVYQCLFVLIHWDFASSVMIYLGSDKVSQDQNRCITLNLFPARQVFTADGVSLQD